MRVEHRAAAGARAPASGSLIARRPASRRGSGPGRQARAPAARRSAARPGSSCVSIITPAAPGGERRARERQASDRAGPPRATDRRSPAAGARAASSATAPRSSRLRVESSKLRMPRSQKSTASAPVGRAGTRRRAATRPPWPPCSASASPACPAAADRLEQRVVVHVARADLHQVGVLRDRAHVASRSAPRSRRASPPRRLRGAASAARRVAVALERVRAGARLERAAAQEAHTARRRAPARCG